MRTYLNASWNWYLVRPWEFFPELYKEVRAFIQRGCRGYADCDVWGFDGYLSRVIAGGLRQLVHGASYPGRGEMDTYKKWQKALSLTAKRFEDVDKYEEVGIFKDKDYKMGKKVYREQKKALKFLVEWFNDLWD